MKIKHHWDQDYSIMAYRVNLLVLIQLSFLHHIMEKHTLLLVIKRAFTIGRLKIQWREFPTSEFSSRFSEHFGEINQVFRPAERSRLVYEIVLRCPYRSPEPLLTGKWKWTQNRFSLVLQRQTLLAFDEKRKILDLFRQNACFII